LPPSPQAHTRVPHPSRPCDGWEVALIPACISLCHSAAKRSLHREAPRHDPAAVNRTALPRLPPPQLAIRTLRIEQSAPHRNPPPRPQRPKPPMAPRAAKLPRPPHCRGRRQPPHRHRHNAPQPLMQPRLRNQKRRPTKRHPPKQQEQRQPASPGVRSPGPLKVPGPVSPLCHRARGARPWPTQAPAPPPSQNTSR
jgi:hypothetical protein